jgi:hypothetical protein
MLILLASLFRWFQRDEQLAEVELNLVAQREVGAQGGPSKSSMLSLAMASVWGAWRCRSLRGGGRTV